MCGIIGVWGDVWFEGQEPEASVERAALALNRRGPDAGGVWRDEAGGLTLGHRRLSIIDLSEHGVQPMCSRSGRWAMTFNGEVYNYEELRAELGDVAWRGGSDSEVILECVDRWGVERAVERFVGMFAIAFWDRRERVLHLVRDRLGIKPLCYSRTSGGVAFASTSSALERLPRFDATISREALAAYMRHGCVPARLGIFESVRKVAPGTIEVFEAPGAQPRVTRFWSPHAIAAQGPITRDLDEAVERLEFELGRAVRQRLVADVPLGAFLSGGVDSSAVVASMCETSSEAVRTFSIGFDDAAYDESSHARAVAEHLGTSHTELIASPDDALALIPELASIYDEPFADSSQIPTLLVSKLAREHVTVALSGDGGDELFAGYNRHVWLPRIWSRVSGVPHPVRATLGRALSALSPAQWDAIFEAASGALPSSFGVRLPGDKIHKLARVLAAPEVRHAYEALVRLWQRDEDVVLAPARGSYWADGGEDMGDLVAWMGLADLTGYMPDDILTKVDRASMAYGLEARVPLLDHRVVELALRIPSELRGQGGVSKLPLRRFLYERVPRELIERPKMGFALPLAQWLRGPLRPWAEALLAPESLSASGMLDVASIQRLWRAHLDGRVNAETRLWCVLMFESWRTSRA